MYSDKELTLYFIKYNMVLKTMDFINFIDNQTPYLYMMV